MDYLKRIADEELSLRLEAFGAVQINGPKWCGKTTTAERQAKSVVKLQDPDKRAGYLATIRTKPSILLKGETPRLIDEWQDAPILWDAVRTTVDQRKLKGQFILTGSTVIKKKNEKDIPEEERRMHTGTDFALPTGENIYAAESGTVYYAGYCGGYGNLVKIEHDNSMQTYYAHCTPQRKPRRAYAPYVPCDTPRYGGASRRKGALSHSYESRCKRSRK